VFAHLTKIANIVEQRYQSLVLRLRIGYLAIVTVGLTQKNCHGADLNTRLINSDMRKEAHKRLELKKMHSLRNFVGGDGKR
jgi:hypothetical protein